MFDLKKVLIYQEPLHNMDQNTNGTQPSNGKQQRFCREGNPYFDDFEIAVSTLFESQKNKNPFIESTLELMKILQSHLAVCQDVLSKTEKLVEEARENNESAEEIEKLVALCRAQQEMQIKLVTDVIDSMNKVVDIVFPR